MTSNEKQRLKAGNFVRNNGRVLRTINILRHKYNKLSGIQNVLEDDGIKSCATCNSSGRIAGEY